MVPKPIIFRIRMDVPIETDGEDEGVHKMRTPLDWMVLIHGCGCDDTSTDLRPMTEPLITKDFWPQLPRFPDGPFAILYLCALSHLG